MKLHEKIDIQKNECDEYKYNTDYYGGGLYSLMPTIKELIDIYENKENDYTSYLALEFYIAQAIEEGRIKLDIANDGLWGDTPIEKLFYQCFNYICWTEKIKLFLIPQVNVEANGKDYRVDFLIGTHYIDESKNYKYIVECDGFDYHSSSKQQAKDNQRQRDLENAGYTIIRFSGSEIYNDPVKCVYETLKRLDIEVEL